MVYSGCVPWSYSTPSVFFLVRLTRTSAKLPRMPSYVPAITSGSGDSYGGPPACGLLTEDDSLQLWLSTGSRLSSCRTLTLSCTFFTL
ncbi:hypothetical protein HPB50_021250 [Hyalomma asiaticum]|uniref:Uncharacterized protein n=1 Tax=Hyalomma asiaticum TaxID=266040 RepID=A0ACB7RVJ5_HYAAI|nr:hypothetical protein HPB50_021250 [Hyalomma asiaticum]